MATTKIEWSERVFNPVTGCSKVSEACQNCYAEVMAKRLSGMPASKEKYKNGFKVTLHPECLDEPYKWKKPSMVFVVSMGDLFHEDVPFEYIDKIINVIENTPQHTYQLLTKRTFRMAEYFGVHSDIPSNVWLGTTCESRKHYDRIDCLRGFDCENVKFISCEPLLGDMSDIDLDGIDWVITGGESGVNARRTPTDWFRGLRDACLRWNTPFYFKQWGAWGPDGEKRSKYKNGSLLDGMNERSDFSRRIPSLPEKQLARDSRIAAQIIRAAELGTDGNAEEKVLDVFLRKAKLLSNPRYWELMRTVWIVSGKTENAQMFRRMMKSTRPCKSWFMTPEDAKELDAVLSHPLELVIHLQMLPIVNPDIIF